jgi:hypothetical protein
MTSARDYQNDQERIWSAVILLGSIVLSVIVILVLHLIFRRG